jgi:hypothetical protein
MKLCRLAYADLASLFDIRNHLLFRFTANLGGAREDGRTKGENG